MSFQEILYIYVGVLVVAYVSGWAARLVGGGSNEHLSGAEPVRQRQIAGHLVRAAVEELVLVDRLVRATLTRGADAGRVDGQGVVKLAGLLQVVDDPANWTSGVRRRRGTI